MTNELPTLAKSAKRIIIIGYPASGKTTLANWLSKQLGYAVIHMDEAYPQMAGVSEQAWADFQDFASNDTPVIFEGVLGYRLLRKFVQLGGALPDLIVDVKCAEATRQARYERERPGKKYRLIAGFCKGLETQGKDWFASELAQAPQYFEIHTD